MFVYTSITRWKSDAEKQCQWFYVSRSASGMEAIIAFSKTKKNGGCFKISSFRRECSNVDLKGHCHTAMPLKGTFQGKEEGGVPLEVLTGLIKKHTCWVTSLLVDKCFANHFKVCSRVMQFAKDLIVHKLPDKIPKSTAHCLKIT